MMLRPSARGAGTPARDCSSVRAVAPPTPIQRARQARFETAIGLAAPFLDLVLAIGDRISRIAGPDDPSYPLRPPGQPSELDRLARESRQRLEAAQARAEPGAAVASPPATGAGSPGLEASPPE